MLTVVLLRSATVEVKKYSFGIMSSAFWLPRRKGTNPATIRTVFCIVDYFKMEEREEDPTLNTVNMCYMNLIMLFGIK